MSQLSLLWSSDFFLLNQEFKKPNSWTNLLNIQLTKTHLSAPVSFPDAISNFPILFQFYIFRRISREREWEGGEEREQSVTPVSLPVYLAFSPHILVGFSQQYTEHHPI